MEKDTRKIGFIGLGIMGAPMCANIAKKHGGRVFAFDIDPKRTSAVAEAGATACSSAGELARKCDVIISMVPKSEHSLSLYTELLPDLNSKKTCIDMSTISPGTSVKIAGMLATKKVPFMDAPVVKSRPAAEAGKLGIYAGGDKAVFEKIKNILGYMGENIIYLGGSGSGLVMKICHNALVAQIQNGVNETLSLALKNGINIDDFTTAVSYGGAKNFYLDSKAAALKAGDYTTNFSVDNMFKDLGICAEMCAEAGLNMPGAANALRVYTEAEKSGLGKEDFCAAFKVVSGKNRA